MSGTPSHLLPPRNISLKVRKHSIHFGLFRNLFRVPLNSVQFPWKASTQPPGRWWIVRLKETVCRLLSTKHRRGSTFSNSLCLCLKEYLWLIHVLVWRMFKKHCLHYKYFVDHWTALIRWLRADLETNVFRSRLIWEKWGEVVRLCSGAWWKSVLKITSAAKKKLGGVRRKWSVRERRQWLRRGLCCGEENHRSSSRQSAQPNGDRPWIRVVWWQSCI